MHSRGSLSLTKNAISVVKLHSHWEKQSTCNEQTQWKVHRIKIKTFNSPMQDCTNLGNQHIKIKSHVITKKNSGNGNNSLVYWTLQTPEQQSINACQKQLDLNHYKHILEIKEDNFYYLISLVKVFCGPYSNSFAAYISTSTASWQSYSLWLRLSKNCASKTFSI